MLFFSNFYFCVQSPLSIVFCVLPNHVQSHFCWQIKEKSLFLSMHRHLDSLALAIHYLMVLLIQYICWVSFLVGKHQQISDLELIKAGCKRIKDQRPRFVPCHLSKIT